MKSKIAEDTIAQFEADGLKPTFADCVRLNALGLRVERKDTIAEFAALPRVAFLGDFVLTEPTVAKRMWLDAAIQVVGGDPFTITVLCAYVCFTDAAVLPTINSRWKLRKILTDFRDDVLAGFTLTEIEAAVDYALRGGAPETGEEPEPTVAEKEAEKKVTELPQAVRSTARALLAVACNLGIAKDTAEMMTLPALERMVAVASMLKGAAVKDDEHAAATADFYRTADAIRARMEAEHGDEQH